jgi:hypothetical protein
LDFAPGAPSPIPADPEVGQERGWYRWTRLDPYQLLRALESGAELQKVANAIAECAMLSLWQKHKDKGVKTKPLTSRILVEFWSNSSGLAPQLSWTVAWSPPRDVRRVPEPLLRRTFDRTSSNPATTTQSVFGIDNI